MPARSHHSSAGNLLPFGWGSHQTPPGRKGRKAAAIANPGWCCNFCYRWGMGTQVVCEGRKRRPAVFRHVTKGHPAWFFTSSAHRPSPWLLPSCCYNTKWKKNMSVWKNWSMVTTTHFWLSASSFFLLSHVGHIHYRAHPEKNMADVVERSSTSGSQRKTRMCIPERWTLPDSCINRTQICVIPNLSDKPIQAQI